MSKRDLSAPQLLNGLKLLAVLPPIGIAWLIYLSRWQWRRVFKHPRRIRQDPILMFILLLIAITGLNLNHFDYRSVFLSVLMLVVLANLWLLCQQFSNLITLSTLRKFMIQFGLYLTISGNLFHWLNQQIPLPQWFKFLIGDLLWGYSANQDRLFGSAYNPNDACCLLLIALGLLLAQLTARSVEMSDATSRFRDWLAVMVLCLGIYQTQSRTGLAIMLAGLLITVLHLVNRHRVWVGIGLTSSLLIMWTQLPRSQSLGASLQTRLTIWQNSFDLFKQSPLLGVTYFGFSPRYFQLTGSYVPHAHDIFLMLLASFGILGGLGFALLTIHSGWTLTKSWQTHQHPNLRYFVATLPIIFMYGVTDFVLSSFQVLMIILLLSAYWHRERQKTTWTPMII